MWSGGRPLSINALIQLVNVDASQPFFYSEMEFRGAVADSDTACHAMEYVMLCASSFSGGRPLMLNVSIQ